MSNRRLKSFLFGVLSLLFVEIIIPQPEDSQSSQTIELRVDYSDGVEKRMVLPFQSGMTVFDVLSEAQQNPHGLKFSYTGSNGPAQNFFLRQIDDVKNESGGKNARNWVFWVNNDFADRGFGTCKIAVNDHVLWKFDTFHQLKPGHACRGAE